MYLKKENGNQYLVGQTKKDIGKKSLAYNNMIWNKNCEILRIGRAFQFILNM